MSVFRTPRTMRLERDLKDMNALKAESTIFDFEPIGGSPSAPEKYKVTFSGTTLVPGPKLSKKPQEVIIALGGEYPRQQPNLSWKTSILHPNIWGGSSDHPNTVCLGNFHNQWTPYVRLVDMVEILWDMGRLAILNPYSAGTGGSNANSEWAMLRRDFDFPVDRRPLRDKILGPNDGSSLIRPGGPQDEIILLDDDEGACSK